MKKEEGGVVLAFVGFILLIGAVKGTWQKAWHDLTTGSTSKTVATGNSNGGSGGTQSSNLPGSGPAPRIPVPGRPNTTTGKNTSGGNTTVSGP